MQLHPFKVGDTVYQYNPYDFACYKLTVQSLLEDAQFNIVVKKHDNDEEWAADARTISFEPYDFQRGGLTWSRSKILKQRLIEMRKEYSDQEWREAIFDIPDKQEFTQIAEQMLKDLDELTSIQVGTITDEQLIKSSEDLRDALGHH